MLYREIISVCSQIHTKHINTLCGQNVELYIKTQSVPRSKHSVSVIKTSQLMLYREIIAVCSQIHTEHINTLRGQNVELLNVQDGGITTHWAPRGKHEHTADTCHHVGRCSYVGQHTDCRPKGMRLLYQTASHSR